MARHGVSVVVVTGLSGAGKSTAIDALEDLGFFCVDNLPTPVVSSTVAACVAGGMDRIALGMDVRVRRFLDGVLSVLNELPEHSGYQLSVVFLDATDDALLRRFNSTRRPHPLTATGDMRAAAVLDGIAIERERLAPLRGRATHVIDTTLLSVHELRRRMLAAFGAEAAHELRMRARFVSFGFKYGAPTDADVMFDVRFLPNPYFVDGLRDLPGTLEPVRSFVLGSSETARFLALSSDLLAFCLPEFEREGKSYLTVAIGCTGGRHRSVAIAEELATRLGSPGSPIDVIHRDVHRIGTVGSSVTGGGA
ncbi:MAG: RNase adapter RapZ [Polyangiaceae bacterium]|nr:RNase adapter RapZ [Polyangiaceae bacterium]